ncbi:MAG: DUF4350 domain-containing protein [Gammaproteobacteria bacterium]
MRSNIGARLLSIAGLGVLAFLVWGVYSSIEFYDETEKTSWSLQAIRNPYLAAQQFMQQSGINAVEADSLVGLDSLDGVDTLLITDANQVVNPRQLERVLAWLEKGGNLIVTANSVANSDDLLLDKFNVGVDWYLEENDDSEEDLANDEIARDETEDDKPSVSEALRDYNRQIDEGKAPEEISLLAAVEKSLTTIDFGEEIGSLEIEFDSSSVLTHPYIEGEDYDESEPQPFSWSSSENGIHLMQFDVGSGLLTIISDPTIWTSSRIDQRDHAYLLWVLSSKEGDFAILHPSLRDSFWQLMWNNAPELLIALALSVALWLWHLGQRFGRIVPRDTSGVRALSEHFSATANYLWHRKAGDELIAPLRQQIYRRASRLVPGFASADRDPDRQLELVSQHCGLDAATVHSAFNAKDFNETTFVRTVKLLKKIEQSL